MTQKIITDETVFYFQAKNFEEKVLKSKEVWLILFYSENNDFNKLKPEYEKAALAMNDIFKFGAINIANEKQLALKYKINTSPYMLFFGTNKDEAPKDSDDACPGEDVDDM